jgi:NAD+ synthase (glutamine-hydrolysing)
MRPVPRTPRARLLLTPELSICGYIGEDLFLRPSFIAACDDAVKTVARETGPVKGHGHRGRPPGRGGPARQERGGAAAHNAASVIRDGRVIETYAKRELPNYQVFDERRYFTPGQGTCVFQAGGVSVGLLICEDAWFDEPARLAKEAGAELLAVINASPFHVGKGYEREADDARARARQRPAAGVRAPGGRAGRGGVRRPFVCRQCRCATGRPGPEF